MTLAQAVIDGAGPEELLAQPVPDSYRAAHILREEIGVFGGDSRGVDPPVPADKDVRLSMHVGDVPMPELAPDEALIAVMASAINYNTVWSAMFEPIPTFAFLDRYARQGGWSTRHSQDQHVLGSDAAGVVVRTGIGVRRWKVGDKVVVHPAWTDEQEPIAHEDGMLAEDLRAWGFETNFGSLAHFAVVKATQLLPKPAHLSWEESAANMLCASTAYRMLVSHRGARMKQGDVVLIWGATGGLGGYAVQLVKNGGGIPVGVVGSPGKAELLDGLGCDAVIDRSQFEDLSDEKSWRKLGSEIRRLVGEDPHIVFEHTGKSTFAASVYVARRGGAVVTCGSTTGYEHHFDNRHLWMRLKDIIGSHGANYQEAAEVNRLICKGMIQPTLSEVYTLDEAPEATRAVQNGGHVGKIGVLGLAPVTGLGIDDPDLRERVGEDRIRLFRR